MSLLSFFVDFILHLDVHLGQMISTYGAVAYAILFLIIFVETGLVFVPFLPGDSLLFVAGAFAALGSLNLFYLLILLAIAAVLGDTCNYWIGHFLGERITSSSRLPVKKKHIESTHRFFEKHGGKTILLARFVPVIRTFAPFVAGAGRMSYGKFLFYNVTGGVLWVAIGAVAGYLFGGISIIKNNFTFFILGIVVVSFVPIIIGALRERHRARAGVSA